MGLGFQRHLLFKSTVKLLLIIFGWGHNFITKHSSFDIITMSGYLSMKISMTRHCKDAAYPTSMTRRCKDVGYGCRRHINVVSTSINLRCKDVVCTVSDVATCIQSIIDVLPTSCARWVSKFKILQDHLVIRCIINVERCLVYNSILQWRGLRR